MQLRNDTRRYGLIAVLLHWSMAALVIGLFFLGAWMVDLDYYNAWYQRAPDLHRGFGVVVALLLVLRLAWRLRNVHPVPLGRPRERRLAAWVHRLLYLLVAAVVTTGYLISTANGQPVSVFGWLDIPATLTFLEQQEDIAGKWHEVLAYSLLFLAIVHGLAALKHHFIDHDATLRRMLGLGETSSSSKP